MKLKLKMVAIAAALASLAGGAQADLTDASAQNNGSFSLMAYNTVTFDWYIRDLGYLLNEFLPTGITTSVADNNQGNSLGPNPAAVGDKSPEAGLLINGSVKSNFSDPAFATWLGTQNAPDVKWMVGSYDLAANSTQLSTKRMIVSSTTVGETFTNLMVDNFTASGAWGGLFGFTNPMVLSKTGTMMNTAVAVNGFQSFNGQGGVGESANLYYATRSTFFGSGLTAPNTKAFGNSLNLATVTLEADGDFIYSLDSAVAPVPLPPALWLMGAGLAAIGGMVRRRRADAQQA